MKKYYILAVTFLCLLMGQSGYAQDYQPRFEGDLVSQITAFLFSDTVANQLHEVVIMNNSKSSSDYVSSAGINYLNWLEHSTFDLTSINTTTQSEIEYYVSVNPPPPLVPTWYLDYDGDGYCSETYQSEYSPGYNWKGWTYGYDCDDTKPEFTSVCCPDGYVLNGSNECVKIPCTTTCPAGYVLNDGTCGCEVVIPCEKAAIANSVYDTLNGIQTAASGLPGNIRVIPPSELPTAVSSKIKWTDPDSSFNSTLYRVDHGGGNIEFVYATEGTVSLEDWKNDFRQGLGYESEQYQISVDNANALAAWAHEQGFRLSFTGHSLGGGLANANALATGLPATIYNPAGLHDNTVNDPRLGLNLNNSKNVTAYVVRGEPVDKVNNYVAFTPVRGTTKYIGSGSGAVSEYDLIDYFAGPLGTAFTAYSLHSMDTVISYLDCN